MADHGHVAGDSHGAAVIDESHHALHDMLSLVFVIFLLLSQAGVVLWKRLRPRSFLRISLFGVWIFPFGVSVYYFYWRFLAAWSFFTLSTLYLLFLCTRKPLDKRTPRIVYRWFHVLFYVSSGLCIFGYLLIMAEFIAASLMFEAEGLAATGALLIFYGLYFGVLDRDCAELCTDSMAVEMGVSKDKAKSGLVQRPLSPNICVICNEPLLVIGAGNILQPREPIHQLQCSHQCHEFCLRGWSMIGKKDTCPYPACKEKVGIGHTISNPWQSPSVLWMQLLDIARYLIVWYPLAVVVLQKGLGYFDADLFTAS
jgi:RING finger protein 121